MAITPERLAEWGTSRGIPHIPPWLFRLRYGQRNFYESEWKRLRWWQKMRVCQTTWDPRGPEPYADEVEAFKRREHKQLARELGYVERGGPLSR